MKSASINEIKKELQELPEKELVRLCMSLAKYRKENKEFLDYLIFKAPFRENYIEDIKTELDGYFEELSIQQNLYFVKKGLRRILRILNRYCKFIDDKEVTATLIIYYLQLLRNSGIQWKKNKLIVNLFRQQLKKAHVLVSSLHEDLQHDFSADMDILLEEI